MYIIFFDLIGFSRRNARGFAPLCLLPCFVRAHTHVA